MESKFRFPTDFKRLIKNLSDDNQWNILECLINNNNKVKYSFIQKTLNIQKGTLNYHLKELQKGGWLRRWSQKGSKFNEEGSFYEINQFGLKILEGGLTAMDESAYQKPNQLIRRPDSKFNSSYQEIKSELLEKWTKINLENIVQTKDLFTKFSEITELELEESTELPEESVPPSQAQRQIPLIKRKIEQ